MKIGLILSGACVTALLLAGQPRRDWNASPAVAQSDAKQDIFVVGDVHADYQRLVRVLAAAGVIERNPPDPKHPVWTAGQSIVVFMGDLIDKGPRALDVIDFVRALSGAAKAAGGQVFSLLGNHEAEFLANLSQKNPSQKKSEEFAGELTKRGVNLADVASCRGETGAFLCSEPFALRIRDWFFSHAGNTGGRTLAQLASDLQAGYEARGFAAPELIGANSPLEARLGEKGENGRPWFESGPEHDPRLLLQRYVNALGVKHLVQAHQHAELVFADGVRRERGQMFQRYGLIFLTDTGMSEGINDSDGAVMRITLDPEEAIAICPDGTKTRIWDAKKNPETGAAKVCRSSATHP